MFLHLLHMESDKMFKRRLFWVGLIILIALIALSDLLYYAYRGNLSPANQQDLTWPAGLIAALDFASGSFSFSSWGLISLMIIVGVATAQEYSWGTICLWLSRGVSRPLLLSAKFVIALIPVLLTVLACLLAGGALTAIFSLPLHGAVYTDRVDYGELALGTLRTAYIILPYVALSFMLAVVTRSTAAAVTGSLVFMLVIETVLNVALPILGKPFAQIAQYLPANLATVIGNQNAAIAKLPIPQGSALAPGLGIAAIGLACYTLLFCGIALWAFQRQNLSN
jgi:ABC-type transport system involved in multi-copper enzyme maturation permease subunit